MEKADLLIESQAILLSLLKYQFETTANSSPAGQMWPAKSFCVAHTSHILKSLPLTLT